MTRSLPVLARSAVASLVLTAAHAALAAPALHVEESTIVAAPPATVWKLIGDYGALQAWHPAIARTDITKGTNNTRGAIRSLTTQDGAKIVEELLAYDGKARSMTYRFLDTPMPITDYVATLAVMPEGDGSRIVWKSDFNRNASVDDAKAKGIITGIYQAGLDALHKKLDTPAAH